MNIISLAIAATGAALVFGSSIAKADQVVCNEEGDCWKVKEVRRYEPSLKHRVYPGNWKWSEAENSKYRWRETRDGNGYTRNGVWVEIK